MCLHRGLLFISSKSIPLYKRFSRSTMLFWFPDEKIDSKVAASFGFHSNLVPLDLLGTSVMTVEKLIAVFRFSSAPSLKQDAVLLCKERRKCLQLKNSLTYPPYFLTSHLLGPYFVHKLQLHNSSGNEWIPANYSLHIDKGFPARKLKEVNFYVPPSFFHFSSSNLCRPTFSCVRNISLTKTSCRLDCYLIQKPSSFLRKLSYQ